MKRYEKTNYIEVEEVVVEDMTMKVSNKNLKSDRPR